MENIKKYIGKYLYLPKLKKSIKNFCDKNGYKINNIKYLKDKIVISINTKNYTLFIERYYSKLKSWSFENEVYKFTHTPNDYKINKIKEVIIKEFDNQNMKQISLFNFEVVQDDKDFRYIVRGIADFINLIKSEFIESDRYYKYFAYEFNEDHINDAKRIAKLICDKIQEEYEGKLK